MQDKQGQGSQGGSQPGQGGQSMAVQEEIGKQGGQGGQSGQGCQSGSQPGQGGQSKPGQGSTPDR
jgi:translation initiation factor IF-2